MPPAKLHSRPPRALSKRSVTIAPATMHSDAQSSQLGTDKSLPDQTLPRPAMPPGTVRARRIYPRSRKGKARLDAQLEPAVPNPLVVKHSHVIVSHTSSPDSNKSTQNTTLQRQKEEVRSATPHPKISQSNDNSPAPTIQTPNPANASSSGLQEVMPIPTQQGTHQDLPHSHEMHPSRQHLSQGDRIPAAPQYHPELQHRIFPLHQQTTFQPNQVPYTAPVAHLVPTQPPVYVSTSQQDMQSTKTQQIRVQTSPSPQTSVQPHQYSVPTTKHDIPSSSSPQETTINHPHLKSLPKAEPKSTKAPKQQLGEQSDNKVVVCRASDGAPSKPNIALRETAKTEEANTTEVDKIALLVSRIKASADRFRARPLICQDITNSNADTLRISRLPRGVTYDRLLSLVEPFGEVEDLAWTASDPYVCEVTYRDAAAAHEAKHFLGDALVGSDAEPPLKAELRSRDPGAQLFVGDLTPDVTEEMLEQSFSELVGEPVTALLKRDPDSFSPIGYGFLSFRNESSANFALVAGHRIKVGNACVRVGRAERNTYLYVSDLSASVSMKELKDLFGEFGALVDEDTIIVRRSYAFVRYKNRGAAEKAKRTLDKTDLKGRLSVRYAEAEPLKACVAVQFHSSVPRPPNSLRDLLTATFSKYGNCSVEIPRLSNGMWRKVAFVTFHGEPVAANLAALEAVQSVRFVSSLPVCCQFARELIPRLPSGGASFEKAFGSSSQKENMNESSKRFVSRNFLARKNALRPNAPSATGVSKETKGIQQTENHCPQKINVEATQQGQPDFVPVYVPLSALHHPNNQQLQPGGVSSAECDLSRYHWQGRVLVPNGNPPPQNMVHSQHASYNSFPGLPERPLRW